MKKALKKDGLSVQNIGNPKSLFSLLFFFLIINVFIFVLDKTAGFGCLILYKRFLTLEPLFRGHPWGREGKCPPDGGRGWGWGYSWEFLVGVCRPVLQILTRFQPPKCNFPHLFSDWTSKIHTRFQTWLLAQTKKLFKSISNSHIRLFLSLLIWN